MSLNDLKPNYYALLIAIVKNKTISESLRLMGLTEGMNEISKANRIRPT